MPEALEARTDGRVTIYFRGGDALGGHAAVVKVSPGGDAEGADLVGQPEWRIINRCLGRFLSHGDDF